MNKKQLCKDCDGLDLDEVGLSDVGLEPKDLPIDYGEFGDDGEDDEYVIPVACFEEEDDDDLEVTLGEWDEDEEQELPEGCFEKEFYPVIDKCIACGEEMKCCSIKTVYALDKDGNNVLLCKDCLTKALEAINKHSEAENGK